MQPEALKPEEHLQALFSKARQADEFEYCCTLLRVRGIEFVHADPLRESSELAHQLIALTTAPLQDPLRLRLTLFLYCHMTEMADLYSIPANMLRVILGDRYSMDPFIPAFHHTRRHAKYPTEKAARIREWATDANLEEIGSIFETMLVKEVRNAFYHSDYFLTGEGFHIKTGKMVRVGNIISHTAPWDWLIPRMELGINTALAMMDTLLSHIRSYKKDKVVSGRFAHDGSYTDIQLTIQEGYGLIGFKSPPDADLEREYPGQEYPRKTTIS